MIVTVNPATDLVTIGISIEQAKLLQAVLFNYYVDSGINGITTSPKYKLVDVLEVELAGALNSVLKTKT